ncbi:MAG: hypothetical protein IJY21_03525 [Clostridia bacterium]|nr:hypothetical protein [Clostridia bacterium]
MAKTKKTRFFTYILLSVFLFAGVSCGKDNGALNDATELATPSAPVALTYQDRTAEDYVAFKDKVDDFAASFADNAYKAYDGEENFAVSPLSVFSALSLAVEGADGATRSQLLSALGVSYAQLQENYSALYSDVTVTHTDYSDNGTKTYSGEVQLSNSVWIQEGVDFKQPTLDMLASKYYAYSYLADFKNDNGKANKSVTAFIKEQTRGLIEKDYGLSTDTVLALINTLYLKDGWLNEGDLPMTAPYTFTNADGSTLSKSLLRGKYMPGRAYETEKYSLFYTKTANDYAVKFILPKDGYSVTDVFTTETLSAVNAVKSFNATDHETDTVYYTRCLFPEFTAEYDENIKTLLKEQFGVTNLFDKDTCNFNNLIQTQSAQFDHVWCEKVQHTTKLFVDKTGIEGAAVTVIEMDGSTSAPTQEVYNDFIVDKAFGFIISSPQNITLFSGVVENI